MIDNDPAVGGRDDPQRISRLPVRRRVLTALRSPASSPGTRPLGVRPPIPETRFVEASGMTINTIYPNDFSFWELIHELVQQEPPEAVDPELLGLLAAVGIVHGKPFQPDARMRKILEDAVVVGNATARTVTFAQRPEEGFAYYPGLGVVERAVCRWLPVPRPPTRDHPRRPGLRAERRCPQAQLADQLLLHGHRDHPGDVHASHRHRLAVHLCDARQRRQLPRRCPQLPPDAPTGRPREPLLVVR